MAPYISSGIFFEILKLWIKGFEVIDLDVLLLFETKVHKPTKPIIVVWVDPEKHNFKGLWEEAEQARRMPEIG